MSKKEKRLEAFLRLSSALTGFTPFSLRSTGQAEAYLATLRDVVGEATLGELLDAFGGVAGEAGGDDRDEAAFERGLRREVLSHDKLGPVARHLIKLWYVGTWYELPREWQEAYGTGEGDRTFVVSPEAYTEGLLWPAVGANPSGAKPHGYGMWATKPHLGTSFDEN